MTTSFQGASKKGLQKRKSLNFLRSEKGSLKGLQGFQKKIRVEVSQCSLTMAEGGRKVAVAGNYRSRIADTHDIHFEHFDNPWNFFNVFTQDDIVVLRWCCDNGLIVDSRPCMKKVGPNRTCDGMMNLSVRKDRIDGYSLRCKKNRDHECSVRLHTFFDKSKLAIQDIMVFMKSYLDRNSLKQCSTFAGISYGSTAVDWGSFMRELFKEHIQRNMKTQRLTGTIEIDESLFGRKVKYHRGNPHRGCKVWVFGMVERDSNSVILYPVTDRKATTLLPIIQRHVTPGSTIYSDGWSAYCQLNELGYRHFTVIHKYAFRKVYENVETKERETVHTNRIEGAWKHAKDHFKRMSGTKSTMFEGHMAEVIWRSQTRHSNVYGRFHELLTSVYTLQEPAIKTVSLPTTPLSEAYDFTAGVEGDGAPGRAHSPTGAAHADVKDPQLSTISGFSVSQKTGAFSLGGLASRGVSVLMDTSPVLSKSRTEKFHKLFKSVPDHEFPIDYFSCAYIGDILLQGNLYVSQNWFCFYSRIRGRGRLLEIPMDTVISITREKTAIIFPNAIGLQTKKEKFAFGSFISRDNTYKFLVSIWKKSQETKKLSLVPTSSGLGGLTDREADMDNAREDLSENCDNNNVSNISHSKSDSTDQSDISVCLECGSVDPSDNNEIFSKEPSDNNNADTNSSPTHEAPSTLCRNRHHHHSSSLERQAKASSTSQHRHGAMDGQRLQFPYSVMHCIDRKKTVAALQKSAVKLQKIPRTNLLLAVCLFLVLFLLLSSVGLTYKILDLQAKLESQGAWSSSDQRVFRDQTSFSMLDLHNTAQQSTAQHMQNVIKANLRLLEEINSSLRSLQEGTKVKPPD